MSDSIFKSALRALFVSAAVVLGVMLGFFLIVLAFASSYETASSAMKITSSYKPVILPNAEGVRKSLSSSAPVILQLNIKGTIGNRKLTQETVTQQLIESREGDLKDDRVKALLVYINSPGGTADDSEGIYRAIKAYKERYKVPVYAYVDGICASGGYMAACASEKIFARSDSIIGSVGVVTSPFLNYSNLLEKIGVQSLTISEGIGKDSLNPMRPWKEGEAKNIENIIKAYYHQFVELVTSNRKDLDPEKLVDEYGAKIFTSSEALARGFIDQDNASYDDVLQQLALLIGVTDNYYQVVKMDKKNWFDEAFNDEEGLFGSKANVHTIDVGDGFSPELRGKVLYFYRMDN